MEYYRLQKIDDNTDINLEKNVAGELSPTTEAGIRRKKDENKAPLSEIIKILNEKFGTEFDEADRLFFEQIVEDFSSDEQLKTQAKANTLENFKFPFKDAFNARLIDRMNKNQSIVEKIMEEGEFADIVTNAIMKEVYRKLTTFDNLENNNN